MIADVSISISPVLHAVDFAMKCRGCFLEEAAFAAYHSVDAPCPFKKRETLFIWAWEGWAWGWWLTRRTLHVASCQELWACVPVRKGGLFFFFLVFKC